MDVKKKVKQIGQPIKKRAGEVKAYVIKHPAKTTAWVLAPLAVVVVVIKAFGLIVALMTTTAEAVYLFMDRYFIGIITLVIIIVGLSNWWSKRKKEKLPPPPPPVASIELAKERAEKTRQSLRQCMYIFTNELCKYFSGLIVPFSIQSVEYKAMPYTITADFITKFHFKVGKGDCIAPRSDVWEVLESIIEQHLCAGDLPMSIPAVYVSGQGDRWPGLVVDSVEDLGENYRVDLVITNEAEAARLKLREASKLDGGKAGTLYDDQL